MGKKERLLWVGGLRTVDEQNTLDAILIVVLRQNIASALFTDGSNCSVNTLSALLVVRVTRCHLNLLFHFHNLKVKKVKVSHSLITIGAVGVRVPLYLGHS